MSSGLSLVLTLEGQHRLGITIITQLRYKHGRWAYEDEAEAGVDRSFLNER